MDRSLKLMMLPWLAYGHISTYLELAKLLSRRDFTVFLVSTPANLATVEPSIKEEYSHSIRLIEIHLPARPDLPPHYHTTKTLPPRLNSVLMMSFDEAGPALSDIISDIAPDLLVYDGLLPWALPVARSHGIPSVMFSTANAWVVSIIVHMSKRKREDYPFKLNIGHGFRSSLQLNDRASSTGGGGMSIRDRCLQCIEGSSGIVLIKTIRELEGKHMDYLSSLTGKKIVPIYLLAQDHVTEKDKPDSNLLAWLDKKERWSTVFVSFGSECFLDKIEREEVAYGLEVSGVNFIWVIRFPKGEEMELEEALPGGFLERVGNRGIVVKEWAPQGRILAHPSVGGFVSHCGWASVTESMNFGVPIIAVPMHLDQPLNARVVEEAGVGKDVRRGEGGRLDGKEIARAVRDVMVEEEGKIVREKARQFGEMIRNRGGDAEVDELVLQLNQICRNEIKHTL